jgi:hypothetical protein
MRVAMQVRTCGNAGLQVCGYAGKRMYVGMRACVRVRNCVLFVSRCSNAYAICACSRGYVVVRVCVSACICMYAYGIV